MATYTGTAGDDTFVLKGYGRDTIVETLNQGTDTVQASFDHVLPDNVENLTLVNDNRMLTIDFGGGDIVTLARAADPAKAIVGSWALGSGGDRTVITFLQDGSYILSEDGPTEPYGHRGMELGKYTWNASTGEFSSTQTQDTNGNYGLSDTAVTAMNIVGDTLTASTEDGEFAFQRVVSASKAIVGGWYVYNAPEAKGIGMVTFLADGTYMFAQDGDRSLDPTGQDGMERGTYTWNASTGAFSSTAIHDTTGEWGLAAGAGTGISGATATVRNSAGTGNALANVLTGDGGANSLSGLGGNDVLKANAGNDKLLGGAGADRLYGGGGKDTLNGGTGADKFCFDKAPASGNVDSISGWDAGQDKIVLDDDAFGAFGEGSARPLDAANFHAGAAAGDADDRIVYDSSTGKLYYDPDGTGEALQQQIATLAAKPVLAATDFQLTG